MFSYFRLFTFRSIFHSSVCLFFFFFFVSPKNYSQGFFGTPKGWPNNREEKQNKVFLVVSCLFFSISSAHGHLSSSYTLLFANVSFIPCFLIFVVTFFFFAVVVFACFYSSLSLLCCLLFIQLSVFAVFSLGVTKTRSNDEVSQILIFMFCFGACIPTPSLGPDNNPIQPREEPLQMVCFLPCLLFFSNVLKYLCLQCFLNINQVLPTKWVPIKAMMFHKVQNKQSVF